MNNMLTGSLPATLGHLTSLEILGSMGNLLTGTIASELGLITETLHAATAVATQETEVLRISRPLFLRMLNEYPHLARLLQSRLVSSVEEFSRQLAVIRAKLDHATDLATRKPKVAKTGD